MTPIDDKLQYISLETYRRNGDAIPTPVWFVQRDKALYIRTINNSGKVKRVRNSSKVRVAPCRGDGKLIGDWVNATAIELDEPAETASVNKLLDKKYGLTKKLFDLFGFFSKSSYTTLQVTLL